MLSIFSPKLQGFKKLSFTNVYCSVPKSSDPICAIYLQTRCDPSILNRTSHAIAGIVTLLAVPGFATCSSQSWAEALCMLVFLAVQKHSKIWKKPLHPQVSMRGRKTEDNVEKMLRQGCCRGQWGNENLRSRKRRFGAESTGRSWDCHKNRNMFFWTLRKKSFVTVSQRRKRVQL